MTLMHMRKTCFQGFQGRHKRQREPRGQEVSSDRTGQRPEMKMMAGTRQTEGAEGQKWGKDAAMKWIEF